MAAAKLLSLRAYAAHRKSRGLAGQSHSAVSKAIKAGRLSASVSYDERGRPRVHAARADKEWAKNTSEPKQRPPAHVPDIIPPESSQEELFEGATEPAPSSSDNGKPQPPPISRTLAVQAVYKTQLTRLQAERAAGKLVEKAAVEAQAFTLGRAVREGLLQIAGRVSDQLATEGDAAACYSIVDGEIRAALSALTGEG